MKPRILLLSLGGTITMTRQGGAGITPALTGADLIEAVPALKAVADIEARSLFGLPGASLTLTHLISVANTIKREFAAGFDGIIVVQGTDTIEETAFVLDVLIDDDRPIVVTGAMRGAETPGADGPANILSAALVASSPKLRGQGVTVVLNDEIHAARFVQKSNTTLPSAFTSPPTGPIGFVSEGKVRLLLQVEKILLALDLPKFNFPEKKEIKAVALVPLGLGEDGRILQSLRGLGYAGTVVEGMGAGHIPVAAVEHVSALAQDMPTILVTRVRGGPIYTQTYSFHGSEMDLIERGLVPSGLLNASKARMLLSLLLSAGASDAAIVSSFESFSFS